MKDNLEKIKELWRQLSPIEAFYINLLARFFIFRKRIREIHPREIAVKICILQIGFLAATAYKNSEKLLVIFAIESFIMLAIALIPTLIKRRKFHWIN